MNKPVFSLNNIVLNAKFNNKWDAIRACGQILVDNGYVAPEYIDDMFGREEVASVYLGNNVVIPHGKDGSEGHIIESGLSFLQVPEGVSFGDEDAKILVGIAGKDGKHIDILGSISHAFTDMDIIQKLSTTTDKQYVYSIFASSSEL